MSFRPNCRRQRLSELVSVSWKMCLNDFLPWKEVRNARLGKTFPIVMDDRLSRFAKATEDRQFLATMKNLKSD